jgi:predicted translin family RNA/ssDNA-binding protein
LDRVFKARLDNEAMTREDELRIARKMSAQCGHDAKQDHETEKEIPDA